MSKHPIDNTAFILAAGFGTRLRPYTEHTPKPMVTVGGTPMIDRAITHLKSADVKSFVINTHYKAEILENHFTDNNDVTLIHEPEILDTAGGVKNTLSHFNDPFFVLAGDSVWENAPNQNTINAMRDAWDADKMDILILLQDTNTMKLTHGVGDYDLDASGHATRSLTQSGQYMWTSIRINAPHIFDGTPDGAFSYLKLLDKAQEKGRLHGLIHQGDWHHISTPQDLNAVNEAYERG